MQTAPSVNYSTPASEATWGAYKTFTGLSVPFQVAKVSSQASRAYQTYTGLLSDLLRKPVQACEYNFRMEMYPLRPLGHTKPVQAC